MFAAELINNYGLSYLHAWSKEYVCIYYYYMLYCLYCSIFHSENVKLLLTEGSTVNSENVKPTDTLYFAVIYKLIEVFKMLLEEGGKINAENQNHTNC